MMDKILNKYSKYAKKNKYNISQNEYFLFFSWIKNNLPEQGWKIHISATIFNNKKIINKIFPYFFKEKIDFKIIKNFKLLKESLSNTKQSNLIGKFITIYPKNKENFFKIIKKVSKILKGFKGPWVYTDYLYPKSNNVFYRYGLINKKNNLIKISKKSLLNMIL